MRCACAVRKVGYLGPAFNDGQGDRGNYCVPGRGWPHHQCSAPAWVCFFDCPNLFKIEYSRRFLERRHQTHMIHRIPGKTTA